MVSTQGNEDARQPRVAGVWRMPLACPGCGPTSSVPQHSEVCCGAPGERQHIAGEALSSGVRLEIKIQPLLL